MSVRSLMKQAVTVTTPGSATVDDYGGWTDSPSSAAYAASVQIDSSREGLEFMRLSGKRMFKCYVEASAPIVTGCRLSVTGGEYTGAVINMVGPPVDHAGRGTYWMLRGEEVT